MDLTVTLLLCALAARAEQSLLPFLGIKSPDSGVLSISGNLGRVGGLVVIPPPVCMSLGSSFGLWAEAVSGTCVLWGHTPSLNQQPLTPVCVVT